MAESAESHKEARSPYLTIFIILAVFTGLEIGASFLPEGIKIPVLILLAITKASLVLLYFMHLKSDSRLYAAMFAIGLVLIIPLVLVMSLVMPFLK